MPSDPREINEPFSAVVLISKSETALSTP
jgi:hypothetical protein